MNSLKNVGSSKKIFDEKENIYAKYRPAYPDEVAAYLVGEEVIKAESRVADVGSGTGIFSLQIQPFADTVFAVEPNGDMRQVAETAFCKCGNVISVNGSAENTGLPSNSVDCVTAAQAFHWFDRTAFRRECERILKPDGKVVLLWNVRDDSKEIVQKISKINAAFCDGYKGFSNGMNFSSPKPFDELFTRGYEIKKFENPVYCDLETFIGRNLSSSFAPREDNIKFEPYVNALKELFQEFASNGIAAYPYIVHCYVGQI